MGPFRKEVICTVISRSLFPFPSLCLQEKNAGVSGKIYTYYIHDFRPLCFFNYFFPRSPRQIICTIAIKKQVK